MSNYLQKGTIIWIKKRISFPSKRETLKEDFLMRKVLSFVLVLTLVLSSFSMAFAADTTAAGLTDIAGNKNADAIKVAFDLGIVTGNPDGTYLPAKAVNRAEFAALITRALDVPASALAGYTTTSFKDTTGYGWAVPYLAFAQSKGIMLGDGYGNVMPGRTITVNEAMTMALRAIGYTANSSLLVGAWPANYVSIAQNNDLYADVAKATTVDKANAAQIIYNLLTVQKVAVNSDGATNYLWKGAAADGIVANLLNTNLGCTQNDDVVLGSDYDYDDAIINITDDIGAFGTAYLNSDNELVAFTKDSTALTGSVNDDGEFEVGDVTYDFAANTVTNAGVSFANTAVVDDDLNITSGSIQAFATANSDDDDTVTIHVDLSGKKIKDIYSVSAWKADDADKASSDVQEDITEDKELLSGSFVQNDDDEIDMNSFKLVGAASLDKIAKDDVVAIYTDGTDIRKVTVGTETVTGTIDEINDDNDVLTIGGKDYDVSSLVNADTFNASDVDADGTFYLDVDGAVFSFDGTVKVNTYGVVKAATAQTSFDNYKVKLYTSDDATKTLVLSESDPADIDWTSAGATTISAVTTGALIGYSLDSNGDIDAIDNTVDEFAANTVFKSSKLVGNKTIDSNAVVFTYDGAFASANPADYDVAALGDIDAGTVISTATQPAMYILNDDGKVAALFIGSDFADTESDALYAVFNTRTTTTTDGDAVYKFTGFVDGTAFTYKTDDQSNGGTHTNYNGLAGVFGVYAVTLDASNQITKIDDLGAYSKGNTGLVANGVVDALGSSNTVFTIGGQKYVAADDAVVYKYDANKDTFTVSKLSAIDDTDTAMLYDTKGDDADGIANIVIFQEN
jgi:hypothetical protein